MYSMHFLVENNSANGAIETEERDISNDQIVNTFENVEVGTNESAGAVDLHSVNGQNNNLDGIGNNSNVK